MKKVFFISGRLGGGGSERVITTLANEFNAKGYDTTIIIFGRYEYSYSVSCNVITISYKSDADQIWKLHKVFKTSKPDAIIAFEYYIGMKTVIAALGCDGKVIVSERNDPHKLDRQKVKSKLRNYLYSKADILVCQTNQAREYFLKAGLKNRIEVILNPVKENLQIWAADDREDVIVNFCRLEKQKNLPLLIRAFKKFHETHSTYTLQIYGEGTEKNSLLALIESECMQNIVFINDFCLDVHERALKCAMFVSSSDYEGLSNSMLEALAMGMPVICTNCPIGGAEMVIEDGENGLLVPVKDCDRLVSAMTYIADNPVIAERLGENARTIKDRLSVNSVVNMWEELVDKKGKR